MYIDLAILVILCIIVLIFFRKFSSFIFFIAIFDIFFRILAFVKENIPLEDVSAVMDKYLPTGIIGIINNYTSGIITTILSWIYVAIMAIFLFYICKIFFSKKKL